MSQKLQAMMVSAILTMASMPPRPPRGTDPALTHLETKAEMTETWERFRSFHHGVIQAHDNDQAWPAGKPSPEGSIGDQLLHLVAGQNPLAELLKRLLSDAVNSLPKPPPAPVSLPAELGGPRPAS